MPKLTTAMLNDPLLLDKSNKYAVGRLNEHLLQHDCIPVPKGSRFKVIGKRGDMLCALFPHDTVGLENDMQAFSDGHVRILPFYVATIIGRIN